MRPAAGLILAVLLAAAWPCPSLAARAGVADCLEVPLVTNRIDCLSRAAIAAGDAIGSFATTERPGSLTEKGIEEARETLAAKALSGPNFWSIPSSGTRSR